MVETRKSFQSASQESFTPCVPFFLEAFPNAELDIGISVEGGNYTTCFNVVFDLEIYVRVVKSHR